MILVALPGDYGKPRPALVVQSDRLTERDCTSVIVCPITSDVSSTQSFRVAIEPSHTNGLRKRSEVMVEKLSGAPRKRTRDVIGHLGRTEMRQVDEALMVVLGFA